MTKRIVFQGLPGSYSHIAGRRHFADPQYEYVGVFNFRELFESVTSGAAEYGIVPVENTLAGSVHENYDLLDRYPVTIVGETVLKVEHHLLGIPGAGGDDRLAELRRVFSHPKALEQCTHFFSRYPLAEAVQYSDTAGAAQYVAQQADPTFAAIASLEAAELYKLDVLAAHVEDNSQNYTRFVIVVPRTGAQKTGNKCSLIFTLMHEPGSLYSALGVLARHKVNFSKLESRPIPGKPFEYRFYIDFEMNTEEGSELETVIEEFEKATLSAKVLGLYYANPKT